MLLNGLKQKTGEIQKKKKKKKEEDDDEERDGEQARINLRQGFLSFLLSSHPSLSPFFVASFFHPSRTPLLLLPPLHSPQSLFALVPNLVLFIAPDISTGILMLFFA